MCAEIDMVKVNQMAEEIKQKALEEFDSYPLALESVAQQLALKLYEEKEMRK